MRLLHVVPTYAPAWRYGGPIYSVHGLCTALAKRGHDVTVATTNVDGPTDSDVPLLAPVPMDGIVVRYFPSVRLRRIYYSKPMRSFFESEMRGFDLVHTHSVFLWPTSGAAALARRLGKPYVLSPRGMLVGNLIEGKSRFAKRTWLRFFERRNISAASAVHATSPIETREMLALGFAPRRVIEIPNGVDLPHTRSSHGNGSGMPVPSRYILFLGRINWKKEIDVAIRALAEAPRVALVIAGNDDERLIPSLRSLAAGMGVANRIHFPGFVDGAAKSRLLSNARALILASKSENFGNAAAEALAHGTPVILSRDVGLADFVEKHGGGLIVTRDAASIAAGMRRLWEDDRLRAELSAQGRGAAQQHLSWESVAARFEAEYSSLLAGRSST